MGDLVRPLSAIFWELRGAWASGRRVVLSLDADVARAEGHVTRVSATDSSVRIGDLLVPGDRILALHYPSRLGDSTVRAGDPWAGPALAPRPIDGQTAFDFGGGAT